MSHSLRADAATKLTAFKEGGVWSSCVVLVCLMLLFFLLDSLRIAFRPGLRSLPGPIWARFTQLYRVCRLWTGQCPAVYLELHETYGPVVRTGPNTVSISDPEAIPSIYGISSNFLKSKFYTTMSPYYQGELMDSMFTTRDPAQHRRLKKPVAGKFSMTSIRSMETFADECADIFVKAMTDLEGRDIDFGEWLQWYAFDVIGAITFNHRFGFMEERRDVKGMISSIDTVLPYAGIVGQVPDLHPWLVGNQRLMKFLKSIPFLELPDPLRNIVEITQGYIDEYDEQDRSGENDNKQQRPDFLTWFRAEEKRNNETMTPKDLMNHLSNNLLAGSDTTGISLRAIFYFIIQNPNVYRKLQQEIDEADRAGKLSDFVTYAESLDLKYFQAVMKEAMRCHPGVSYPLERLVPQGGAEICGVKLPAGTVVGVHPAVIHHNTDIYGADAASFQPERWLVSDAEQIKAMDRNLLTFGYGTRTCIGKNISIMEMGKFVPQILRQFQIYWASDKPEWIVKTYWFSKQTGFVVRFQTRNKESNEI